MAPKPNVNPDHPEDRPIWTDTQDPTEIDPNAPPPAPTTEDKK